MPLPGIQVTAIQNVVSELTATYSGVGRKKRNLSDMFMDLVDREAWAEYYNVLVILAPDIFQAC